MAEFHSDVMRLHAMWLRGEEGGERWMNFSDAQIAAMDPATPD